MVELKRKSHFNEKVLTAEQIEAGVLRNSDGSESDEIEDNHGNPQDAKFQQSPVGIPTRGALMESLGVDEQAFNIDPKSLERESTAPCIASPVVMTDELETKVLSAGMIQAALETPQAMMNARVSPSDRKQLASRLTEARKELPTPDAVTFIDNRRVILPAEVRDVPNLLPKQLSMKVLEIIVGEGLSLKVVKCARQAGVCFFQKPCLWLAQRLAQELSKRRIWEKIEVANDYEEAEDGNKDSEICKAIGQLFSYHVMEQMQVICATRRISMQYCAKIMIDRVCEIAIAEKAPKDYTEKYDSLDTLEAALGKLGEVR